MTYHDYHREDLGYAAEDAPLPAKHIGEDDQGRRIYRVTVSRRLDGWRERIQVEVYADPEGDLVASPMVKAELALRGITWDHVRASVIWAMVREHQGQLPASDRWK